MIICNVYGDVVRLPYANNASYNTRQAPNYQEPQGCMEGTRIQIIAELKKWAFDDEAPRVCWLNGLAGTGKTCIAHTLSETLDEEQMLGASFFCSHSASQQVRDASFIIPTVATKLSQASPLLRSAVSQAMEGEPDVVSLYTLFTQFRLLLEKPIQRVIDPAIKTYKIIVIDALDECTNLDTVEKLIEAIVTFARNIPLKFFISSRDTTAIRGVFNQNPTHPPKIFSLHDDVEDAVVQEDIKLYLETSLSAIARRNPHPIHWPPRDELDILLERSDRLFIYAATAIRYIGVRDIDFRKRLTDVTRLTPATMQTDIDSLYNIIMEQAFHSELEPREVTPRRETLSTAVFLLVPLCMDGIASLLSMDSFQTRVALSPFRSVIHVPASDTSPVSIFHTSFRDFIVHPSRCEKFSLNSSEGHRMLTVHCLRCLNRDLKRDIYKNMTPSPSYDPGAIPDGLRYSCLNWASHLVYALAGTLPFHSVIEDVYEFLNHHLLHWFECLSALSDLESGIKSLDKAHEAISVSTRFTSRY